MTPAPVSRDDRPHATGIERIAFATFVLAGLVPPLAVSTVAVAQRAAGVPPTPLVVWLVVLLVVLALGGLAVARRGPVVSLAARFAPEWDGARRRRPVIAWLWCLLAAIAVVQIGRLSLFVADPALRWGSTYPPVIEGVTHMCMSAYVQAGDLVRRGVENVYAEQYYPAFGGGTLGHTSTLASPVVNLSPWLEDPYEYPPPFLLLPRLGLALSNDFLVLRTAWFALKIVVLAAAFVTILQAISPPRARLGALLIPAVVASLPIMFDLQFGQFHLVAVIAAMCGMCAFARGRHAAGGLLLGTAIVTKIFPGLLVVYLLLRRQWAAIAWTAGACLGLGAIAWLAFGAAPFHAFFAYQLPRVASGEAFSFFLRSDLTVASNWGVFGIPIKLGRLGVPGMSLGVARAVTWVYTVLLLAATAVAARRPRPVGEEPLIWLALLVLGSLRSPLAPNVYVGAPALWLLSLMAPETRGRALAIALFVVSFVAIGGLPPMPTPAATILVWMTGQVAMLALGFWVACRDTQVGWKTS